MCRSLSSRSSRRGIGIKRDFGDGLEFPFLIFKGEIEMRTVIIAGGEIQIKVIEKYCRNHNEQSIIIAVDKGLEALYQLKIIPNHVVGDFDSVSPEILEFYKRQSQIFFHKFNAEKDNTDTDIALKLAIKLKSSDITILGALGRRMDHAIANIHILKEALEANISCQIIDEHNRIYLINKEITLKKDKVYGKYVSLIPLTSIVENLTLNGFKYPLDNYDLLIGTSLGVSNEIVEDTAKIKMKKGILIVIESKD